MNTSQTPPHLPAEAPQPLRPARRKRKILLTLGIVGLLVVSAGAAFYWWQNRPIKPTVLTAVEQNALSHKVEAVQERKYEPGAKTIVFTEREVNALFHHNTGQGDKVKFELANNAIHARIVTDLDEDLPVFGGRKLKAKARFELTDAANQPALVLNDLTVWGLSVPNAWLGDIKGHNLLANIGLDVTQNRIAAGIRSVDVDHGKITIKLAD